VVGTSAAPTRPKAVGKAQRLALPACSSQGPTADGEVGDVGIRAAPAGQVQRCELAHSSGVGGLTSRRRRSGRGTANVIQRAVENYGAGNARTVQAGLQTEFGLPGTSFFISKSWQYPEGYNGGRLLNGNAHQLLWKGNPTFNARGTVGVETWRVTADSRVSFNYTIEWKSRAPF
jgi:hypothetical protein